MKKIILLFITTLTLMSFNKVTNSEFSIVGKWQGQDENETGYIIFQKDGYAYFDFQGLIMGGEEFVIKGQKASMTYEVDYSKTPMTIDLIVKKIESGEIKKLLCIAEIINENQIKLQIDFNDNRPTEFNENDSLIFNRVK